MIETDRRTTASRRPRFGGPLGRRLTLVGVVLALVAAPVAVAPAFADPGDITVSDATVAESAGSVTIIVTLEATSVPVDAVLSTSDGTASGGADYTGSTQNVTLTEGTNSFTIPILDDALDEDPETFTAVLTPTGGNVVDGSGLVTITDDDAEPTLSITPAVSQPEQDTGPVPFTFQISLSAPSGKYVGVFISASNGTALADSDYEASSGSFTFAPGVTTMPFTVQVFGESVYEVDQTFSVTLSLPVNASIAGAVGTGTILNDDAPPVLTVSGDTVSEFFDWATVTVTRTGATEIPITVDYATINDSATAPSDYTATTGSLTFAPSTASVAMQTVTVPIVQDTVLEPMYEWFTFALSNPVGATAGAPASVRITDDDALPVMSINDVTLAEGDSGTTAFTFTLSLDKASTVPMAVQFVTADAGAVGGGSDYGTVLGAITVTPGRVSETITVLVTGDSTFEADQDFTVTLSSPLNATIGTAVGTGTIVNDDAAPVFSISPTSGTPLEGNAAGTDLTFTVTRSGATELPAAVQYDAVAGTATAGSDFIGSSGVLNFPASLAPTATETFIVRVNGDTARETNETFSLLLSAPTGATLGASAAVITIVDDDSAAGGLAQTGSTSSFPTLLAAFLLVAAGTGVVIVGRRPSAANSRLNSARNSLR